MKKTMILSTTLMALSLSLSACVVDAGPRNDRNHPNKHDQYKKDHPHQEQKRPNQHQSKNSHYSGKNDRPDTYTKPKPR